MHLAQGGNASKLSSWPPNLENLLDEAWPEEMARIRKDAQAALHSEIEEAHGIVNGHDAQMTATKSDYNQLGEKYNDEVSYWHHVEDKLAHTEDKVTCLQGWVHDLVSLMTR